jgi:hypothetical protein
MGGCVVRMVDGSVNIEVIGTFELITGGNTFGNFVVFNTGGGNMYFILGGQHGIFVVPAWGVVTVVTVVVVVII